MIQPAKNNVLVRPFLKMESDNGIALPFPVETNRVEIVAVGNGSQKTPMKLKVGDIGYRVKDWGEPLIENGITYYLMDAKAIIAIE